MKNLTTPRALIIEFWVILFSSILLTAYFTFPLILNLGNFYNHDTDFYINGWTYWYTTFSVLNGSFFDITKFFNAPILYPFPNILAQLDFALIPSAIFYLPIYVISKNHVLSLNISIFSSFVLNFLSCYFSIKYVTKNKLASFLASIIFSFSPNVIQLVAGHLEYLNRFFVPPFFVLLYEYLKKPKFKKMFFLGLIYTLLWFTNIQLTIFVTITTFIAFPIYLLTSKVGWKRFFQITLSIVKYLPILVIFVPIVVYYFYPYYDYSQKEGLSRSKNIAEYYSPKPIDFFVPFPNNKIFGDYSLSLENSRNTLNETHFNYAERTLLPGYLVLITLPFIIYFGFISGSKRWLFYFFIFIFQLLFSFGPYITFFGQKYEFVYSWIYDITPLLSSVRTPTRIQYVWLFFIAYFAAFGFSKLSKKISPKSTKLLFLTFFVILMAEYSTKFGVIYKSHLQINKINFDLKNKVVLLMPTKDYGANPNGALYNIYQTSNEFISLNGSTGSEWEIEGYSHIRDVMENSPFTNYWFNVLKILNVDYVVIDKTHLKLPEGFESIVAYQDDKWLILNPRLYQGLYGPNCEGHDMLNPDINTLVRYESGSKKLYLSYILKNNTKCDIFLKGKNRYKRIDYKYRLDGKEYNYSKYIVMPTFMIHEGEYGNTTLLRLDVNKTPEDFYLKIDKGNYIEEKIFH